MKVRLDGRGIMLRVVGKEIRHHENEGLRLDCQDFLLLTGFKLAYRG